MKHLYLFRGLPGSGKTTAAREMTDLVFSADDYFTDDDGAYHFDATKLGQAHAECRQHTRVAMEEGCPVAVANTFTRVKEMKEYYELAEELGYKVFSFIVENRHGGENEHNVPPKTIQAMRDRFDVSL